MIDDFIDVHGTQLAMLSRFCQKFNCRRRLLKSSYQDHDDEACVDDGQPYDDYHDDVHCGRREHEDLRYLGSNPLHHHTYGCGVYDGVRDGVHDDCLRDHDCHHEDANAVRDHHLEF
ncbi:unnamed protein product [Haemonchus placei]|uniref:Uncharacterized protein n=1 Tax=Haemonchus placei TaxID=6290 RepID=A0A0N4VW94_HAEPC|nr:unnamed protein product [Haemonchus placei]